MKLEGRSTRQEILKSTVDEIRGKVHQARNIIRYCIWNQREGPSDKKSYKILYMELEGRSSRQEILKSTVEIIREKVNQTRNLKNTVHE